MGDFQIYAGLQSCQVPKRRNALNRKKLGRENYGLNQDDPHTATLQDFSFVNVKLTLLETFTLHHHSLFHGQALW